MVQNKKVLRKQKESKKRITGRSMEHKREASAKIIKKKNKKNNVNNEQTINRATEMSNRENENLIEVPDLFGNAILTYSLNEDFSYEKTLQNIIQKEGVIPVIKCTPVNCIGITSMIASVSRNREIAQPKDYVPECSSSSDEEVEIL